jgi:hypothetical protein
VIIAPTSTDLRRWIHRLPSPATPINVKHSAIGPSSAARLELCPGSYNLARRLQRERAILPDAVSEAAERGTQEHALAEHHLLAGTVPTVGYDPDDLDARPSGEAATRYIETIAGDVARAHHVEFLLVEEMLDARRLHPLLFGTVDGALLWRDDRNRHRLSIYDLKSGSYRVAPSALQLRLYAAFLLLDPRTRDAVADTWLIDTVVVQPHAAAARTQDASTNAFGVSRTHHNHLSILQTAFRYTMAARAAASDYAEDLPLVSGEHCLFCAARPGCPVRQKKRNAKLLAQLRQQTSIDFAALEDVAP